MKRNLFRKSIGAVTLLLLSLATMASAVEVNLQDDGNGGYKIELPCNDIGELTVPSNVASFRVYNTKSNCDGSLEISAPNNKGLQLVGTVNIDDEGKNQNYFRVLDMNDGSILGEDKYLREGDYSVRKTGALVSPSGKMKLNYVTKRGGCSGCDYEIDVIVSVVDRVPVQQHINQVENGSISLDNETPNAGSVVSVTATPASGYVLNGIDITDQDGNKVFAKNAMWHNYTNKATYVAPMTPVEVTPVFVLSEDRFINIPFFGWDTVTVPCNTKFHVYDDGGKDGNYTSYANGFLLLKTKAPCDKFQILSGSLKMNAENTEYFKIHDGSDTLAPYLVDYTYRSSSNNTADMKPSASSTNAMVLRLHSDYRTTATGLDLDVIARNSSTTFNIVVKNDDNGSALSNKNKASFTETVTLTATPNRDYVLAGMDIAECDGRKVPYAGGWYSDNKITFKMPYCDVEATPIFEEGEPFIKMPLISADTIHIQTGTNSFKIYDNGGKNGKYSKTSGDTLMLIAPQGYVFEVMGSTKISTNEKFKIYDGNAQTGSSLHSNSEIGENVELIGTKDTITFVFYTLVNSGVVMDGFDLAVSLVDATQSHSINISGATGGSVRSNVSSAVLGSEVTLNVSPKNGFYLKGLVVKDDRGRSLPVNLISSFESTASFEMPATAVSVIPEWTDDLTAEGGLFMNMPKTGTVEWSIPSNVRSFNLYDDGGSEKSYSNNANGNLKLVAPSNYVIDVKGSMSTQSGYDLLKVYDGDVSENKLLNEMSGSKKVSLRSTGNTMTFNFKSNGSNAYYGFSFVVTPWNPSLAFAVKLPKEIMGGTIDATPMSATYETPVSWTAVPAEGYMLNEVVVTSNNRMLEDFSELWYSNNSGSFSMPYADVTITPTFTNDFTAAGGLYVNMPVSGTKTVNVPAGVTSFMVYDDGGSAGNYSNNASGYLQLIVPKGYLLKVTGSVKTELNQDVLQVRDGDNSGKILLQKSGSFNLNGDMALISSDSIITLHLSAGSSVNMSGLELMVEVASPVKIAEVPGGVVTSDKKNAALGESVTLTITPDDGYLLMGLEVKDADNNVVAVTGGQWYSESNTATFTMPASNVTVTPVWTNDLTAEGGLFVNIPASGSENVVIPAGVTSFKVYDDGGINGKYSWNADGSLTVTAPKDYVMKMSGLLALQYNGATLSVYDGVNNQATPLVTDLNDNSGTMVWGPYIGWNNSMTFYFKSTATSEAYVRDGLYLLVELIEAGDRAVKIASEGVDGGSVVADHETARWRDSVTVTATPAKGYVLSDVTVVDADGNPVEVVGGKWYTGNQVKFAMPNKSVTVTPSFTDDLKNLYVNFPKGGADFMSMTSVSVAVPTSVSSFMVYDDGGKDGNHGSGTSVMFIAAAEGTTLELTGTVSLTEEDQFAIYDRISSKILFQNTNSAPVQGLDIGTLVVDTLMIFFSGSGEAAGFELKVTAKNASEEHKITPVDVAGGKVTPSVLTALPNDIVTITATPDANYFLAGFEVMAGDRSIPVRGGDFVGNAATFVMPTSDVTVKPLFTQDLTGLSVNMPTSGTKIVDLPAGMESFKVYDDGGKDLYMGRNGEVVLVLNPAKGKALQISGTVDLCRNYTRGIDSMAIVRVSDDDEKVLWASTPNNRGQHFDVPELVSAGSVRIYLYTSTSANEGHSDNIDLSVEVLDATASYNVEIADADGGEIKRVKTATTASAGEDVALTATPNEKFILSEIQVADEKGKTVNVEGGRWYSDNAASFIMPSSKVTVTSTFTDNWSAEGGLYVNMVDNGTKNVTIPAGVTSFKVYDDGGKGGNHSKSVNSELILTAPEGCVMYLSGTMKTDENGWLTVNDGSAHGNYKLIEKANANNGEYVVGKVVTTGNVMRIGFTSFGGTGSEGLDLKVEVANAGAVKLARVEGKLRATINGNYTGTETLSIPDEIEVDEVDYDRELEVGVPVTAMLPVSLPDGASVNADFYTLEKVEQVGDRWQATMTYIGDGKLPQPNTPYAVILPEGETKLEFNLNGKKATVQTGAIQSVCGLDKDCVLDEKGNITDDWFFTGTYAYKVWNGADEENGIEQHPELGLAYAFAATDNPGGAAKGKFGRIVAGAHANPMRCYLRKRDASVKLVKAQQVAAASYVARYSVNYVPETETIDVDFVKDDAKGGRTVLHGRMNTVTGEFKTLRDFDLKGRKVNSANRARGAYYGKKVLKK